MRFVDLQFVRPSDIGSGTSAYARRALRIAGIYCGIALVGSVCTLLTTFSPWLTALFGAVAILVCSRFLSTRNVASLRPPSSSNATEILTVNRDEQTRERIQVVLISSHPMILAGIRVLLSSEHDFKLISDSTAPNDVLRDIQTLEPDIVLIDTPLPGGTRTLDVLRELHPQTHVVLLTLSDSIDDIPEAARVNIAAVVPKAVSPATLLSILRRVVKGETLLRLDTPKLTARELEILQLLTDGHRAREIAEHLSISVTTVMAYRKRLMEKLRIGSEERLISLGPQEREKESG